MEKSYVAEASVTIHAPASRVWQALTDPQLIKQYMFGSEVVTDWKEGHPIVYKGMWQGKPFEDKGKVVKVEREKALVTTHWSPMSGTPDSPDNYHQVSYQLEPVTDGTRVTLRQDNNASEEEREHSSQNWKMMLDNLKKLLE